MNTFEVRMTRPQQLNLLERRRLRGTRVLAGFSAEWWTAPLIRQRIGARDERAIRTWAPEGHKPMLQRRFSWKHPSVIAGLSCWRYSFRRFNGAIKSPQILEFLNAVQKTIGRKILIVWDRMQAHRSKLMRAHVTAHGVLDAAGVLLTWPRTYAVLNNRPCFF